MGIERGNKMSIQGIGQDYIPQGVKVEIVKPAETNETTDNVKNTAQTTSVQANPAKEAVIKPKDIVLPFGHSVDAKKDYMKGLTVERQYDSKADREKAEKEATEKFMNYGLSTGQKVKTEKEAKDLAERYVENEHHREAVETTHVFMDKADYKRAQKARKAEKKTLVEQYREQGLSRREAKRRAESELVDNEYIRGRKTRRYIEQNRGEFYDENGNFSSDMFKKKVVDFANLHTKEGETTNYHLSLRERRQAAQQEGVTPTMVKHMAKKANLDYEKDRTNLYRGLAIAGGVAAGYGAGTLFSVSSAAAASSAAGSAAAGGAGSAAAGGAAAAAAAAKVSGVVMTTPAGGAVGLGLASLIRDGGKIEDRVYAPGEKPEKPVVKPPVSNPDTPPVKPDRDKPVPPPKPVDNDCPVEKWQSEYCDHKVKRGENWSTIILGKVRVGEKQQKPSGHVLKALIHAEKLKHGVTNFNLNTMPSTMRLYTEFSDLLENEKYMKKYPELRYLKDLQITVDCDGRVAKGKTVKHPRHRYVSYTGAAQEANHWKQDCNDNVPVRIK